MWGDGTFEGMFDGVGVLGWGFDDRSRLGSGQEVQWLWARRQRGIALHRPSVHPHNSLFVRFFVVDMTLFPIHQHHVPLTHTYPLPFPPISILLNFQITLPSILNPPLKLNPPTTAPTLPYQNARHSLDIPQPITPSRKQRPTHH